MEHLVVVFPVRPHSGRSPRDHPVTEHHKDHRHRNRQCGGRFVLLFRGQYEGVAEPEHRRRLLDEKREDQDSDGGRAPLAFPEQEEEQKTARQQVDRVKTVEERQRLIAHHRREEEKETERDGDRRRQFQLAAQQVDQRHGGIDQQAVHQEHGLGGGGDQERRRHQQIERPVPVPAGDQPVVEAPAARGELEIMLRVNSPVGIEEEEPVVGRLLHVESPEKTDCRQQERNQQPAARVEPLYPVFERQRIPGADAVPAAAPRRQQERAQQGQRSTGEGNQQQESGGNQRQPVFSARFEPLPSVLSGREVEQQKRRDRHRNRSCPDRRLLKYEPAGDRVECEDFPEENINSESRRQHFRQRGNHCLQPIVHAPTSGNDGDASIGLFDSAQEIPFEEPFRIERTLRMAERLFVHILFAVHEFRFVAERDRQLPGQRLRCAFRGMVSLLEMNVHRVRRNHAVDRESGGIIRFGIEDDAAQAELFEVLPGMTHRLILFFEEFTGGQPGIELLRQPRHRGNLIPGDLPHFGVGPVGLELFDQIVLLAELRPGEGGDLLDRIEIVDRAFVVLQLEKLVAVGVPVEELLGHVIDAALGQPRFDERVGDLLELFGRRPFPDGIMDGAVRLFVNHETFADFREGNSVRLPVHEQIGEAAFAALRRLELEFFFEKPVVGQSDGAEIQIDFHSTRTRCCLPGA